MEGRGRMERKSSYSKYKDSSPKSWMAQALYSRAGGDRPNQPRFFLKKSSIVILLVTLTIVSLSGVASLRLLSSSGQNPARDSASRELLEERDPSVPYRLGPVITDWDEQRSAWLEKNPHMRQTVQGKPRLFLITGSQSSECANPMGDFWLLKALKNKMDYCRIHNIDSYYNMAVMERAMLDFWVKLPLIRKMMLAHPEAEWIWWMDSDAMFTDMAFEIPLEKYKEHNMVIHGWPSEVFEKKNWVGLNAGIFLLRNCQWTLDFLDLWASLGEDRGKHRWIMGKTFTAQLAGRVANFPADDQSALIYLLNNMKDSLHPKIFIESSYYLHGFWVEMTDKFQDADEGFGGDGRWPFITHFVGCKLCGNNNDYPTATCLKQMSRAFNFADNQVIREFGYRHESLESPLLRRIHNDSTHPLELR